MKRVLFTAILTGCCALATRAQSGPELHALSGPAGNYIYLVAPGGAGYDTAKLAAADYYLIERTPRDSANDGDAPFREIGKSAPIASRRELRRYFSEADAVELEKVFSLKDEDELLRYFQAHRNPADYFFYYLLMEIRLATGDIYLDADAKRGMAYVYRVTRVDKSGAKEAWGTTAAITTGAPNAALPLLRPLARTAIGDDSSVTFSWRIPVDSIAGALPEGFSKERLAFTVRGIRASVMMSDPLTGGYRQVARLLPTTSDSEGAVIFTYRQELPSQQLYHAFLITEDEVGAAGVASDTLDAYTVTQSRVVTLREITTKDVVDGVQISWKPVALKPYIRCIAITRYDNEERLDSVAILPVTDTTFVDRNIKAGVTYTYQAKLIYQPGLGLRQIAPAQGTGTYLLFSKPTPPYNLKALNVDSNIRLDWESANGSSLYGFYIYRGTSLKNMELIAGPVKRRFFVDTAAHLSGRTQYFYAVTAQNLRQDYSGMSDAVSALPNRQIRTEGPSGLKFYYANGSLKISWTDVREDDNAITGYIVRGREKGASEFRFFTPQPVAVPYTEDNGGFTKGSSYRYQAAAISMRGDTSAFSEFYEFTLPKDRVQRVNVFYVRNTSEGVTISWPQVTYPERRAYNIYRRAAEEDAFTKIGTIMASQFSVLDKTVKPDATYVYAITVVEMDGREGEQGDSKSIHVAATPVKATTID